VYCVFTLAGFLRAPPPRDSQDDEGEVQSETRRAPLGSRAFAHRARKPTLPRGAPPIAAQAHHSYVALGPPHPRSSRDTLRRSEAVEPVDDAFRVAPMSSEYTRSSDLQLRQFLRLRNRIHSVAGSVRIPCRFHPRARLNAFTGTAVDRNTIPDKCGTPLSST